MKGDFDNSQSSKMPTVFTHLRSEQFQTMTQKTGLKSTFSENEVVLEKLRKDLVLLTDLGQVQFSEVIWFSLMDMRGCVYPYSITWITQK